MMSSGGELAVTALAVPKAEKTGLGMDGKGSLAGHSRPVVKLCRNHFPTTPEKSCT